MNTKNWNQLTTDGSEEETYRHYDGMIATALETIQDISSNEGVIRLYHFNRKNKEHMCILRIALIARDLFQYPIEVDASWWDVAIINWRLRKNFDKIKRLRLKLGENDSEGINMPMMLDLFAGISAYHFGSVKFKDIYEAYYERKM